MILLNKNKGNGDEKMDQRLQDEFDEMVKDIVSAVWGVANAEEGWSTVELDFANAKLEEAKKKLRGWVIDLVGED